MARLSMETILQILNELFCLSLGISSISARIYCLCSRPAETAKIFCMYTMYRQAWIQDTLSTSAWPEGH